MSEPITGSCLCKSLRYTIKGEFVTVANCHCNTCKKSSGAAFATLAVTQKEDFAFADDTDLAEYRISDKAVKLFCRQCGTPIYNVHQDFPGFCMVHVGSLDRPCQWPAVTNFFCERMLPWVKEIAGLESFDRLRG